MYLNTDFTSRVSIIILNNFFDISHNGKKVHIYQEFGKLDTIQTF